MPTFWQSVFMPTFYFLSIDMRFSHSCIARTFDGEPAVFTGLQYSIRIKRNPTFYDLVIVKPAVILSAMTILMFLMPPSAADRYCYGEEKNNKNAFQ